jgi:hypothetical protein
MVATIDSVTAVMVNKRYFPIKGITIDVGGIISASNKKKTVKDRSMDIQSVIFSPLSEGR